MKKSIVIIALVFLAAPLYAQQKVIALGDVEVGADVAGQRAYDVKETLQIGIKKEIEKKGKGEYAVNIVSPAVVTKGVQPEATNLPEMPTDRVPTQKEMAQYMAALQQYQKEIMGQIKVHKPVTADAYFDFKVVSGQSGMDTGGVENTIGEFTGHFPSVTDIGTKTTKVYVIATMRDPQTGALMDKYTAKASSLKVRNIAGYTDYNYGSDDMTRESLFRSAVKDCAKWIMKRVK